jgi:NAD(P)-dependent dehydrogenase (short-subunit alcohol dehydrogenase family)
MSTGNALAGRVALVTGGGGEIGGAIARRFAAEGARIVVADLRLDAAQRVAADVVRDFAGGEAVAVESDVSDPAGAQRAVQCTLENFGKLTTLVHTAAVAVTPTGTVETLTLEEWVTTFAVNLTGAFLVCKYAVPEIRKAGGGTIIHVGSQLGQVGVPGRSPYSASKAALIQFAKCLAVDHAKDGIRVNSISPGGIDTMRIARRYESRAAADRARGPAYLLGRTGRVNEVAAGALFLASDESSFMTGADLLVDGGYLAFKGMLAADGTPQGG